MTELGHLGRYRLVRRLAVGGVAEVYLAFAEGPEGFAKQVVVKRLIPAYVRDRDVVSMFVDEARLMALLRHPHVVEVYDIGAQADEYYIAMEHVPGRDLRDLLDASPGEPLPLAAALHIVGAVAEGLHHAHGQRDAEGRPLGVVHRDVTPSNVLLGWQGVVKLTDFGVAKWAAQRSRTEQGTLKGKLAYMSPEQCRAEALDCRSDVFALGVLLYELTTGQRPFRADSDFETLSAIVGGRYPAPASVRPDYPAPLAELLARALRVDRQQRHPDAAALGAALREAAAAIGVAAAPPAVAALLAERFPEGERAQGAEAEGEGASFTAPGATLVRPRAERTLTDPSAIAPAVVSGAGGDGQPSVRRPRWQRAALPVAAAVALAATAAGLVTTRTAPSPPPSAAAAPGPATGPALTVAPQAPATAPAPSVAPPSSPAPPPSPTAAAAVAPPTSTLPPAPAPAAPAAVRTTARPARPREPKAPKRPAADPAAPAAEKRIWDPDSPFPP